MRRPFYLGRMNNDIMGPVTAELIGRALENAAENDEDPTVAQALLHLAADAFDTAASLSIGHKLAERYTAKAKVLRGE